MSSCEYPKNGLLSGMVMVYATATLVVLAGLFLPPVSVWFSPKPSTELLNVFLVSIVIMAIHKFESYKSKEFDRCPVYLATGSHARWMKQPREVLFVGFVGTFLILMVVINLVMRGAPWPLLLMLIWLAQGLHEIHHSAKTCIERRYYPGVVSSLLFVLHIDLFMVPLWFQHVFGGFHWSGYLYYASQPIIFLAFAIEHRSWCLKIRTSP